VEFTHLHVASCLSSHFGTAWPEELVDAQAGAGAQLAALTDRDGLYGAVRHVRACLEHGVAPVVGVDLLVASPDDAGITGEVTVLAHGHDQGQGWAAVCRLISAAWVPRRGVRKASGSANQRALATRASLRAMLADGAGATAGVVLLGPGSDVGQAVLAGDLGAALARLRAWTRLLPGGVRIEIVCHYARPGLAASLPHAAAMLRLARAEGVPAVLTNAVRYLVPDDAVVGDVLDAAALLLPLGSFPAQPNAQAWLKPPQLMRQIAAEVTDASGGDAAQVSALLDETDRVAGRCRLDPEADLGWRRPKVPGLDALGLSGDPQQVLTAMCRAGLPARYPGAAPPLRRRLLDRLDDELGVIAGFGFATYFLTVADIVTMIKAMGIRVQARGSGAGSLVNYALGVSSVDPVEHDLLFERFLGVQRSTLPDIDLDVESARRREICRAVVARYAPGSVTLLASQNQYRARGAVRDAGMALGVDPSRIDHIASSLWRLDAVQLEDALTTRPELADLARAADEDPQVRRLLRVAGLIDRLPRHVSMHPCGVIVSDDQLLSVTPTQPSGLGLAMSQFDKDDIDDMGLLKLDVLGVRMQSALAHALDEIRRTTGERIDLGRIPHDDAATFDLICSTHTLGVFQIESPGQRELVGKMQPDCMSDLVADISLFRPGPMKGNMVTPYVDAKLGWRAAPVLHPLFRPILADAHGVVIYHEHILRILHLCMGVSLAEADELRRHLARDADAIEAQFRQATARQRGPDGRRLFTPRQVDAIWAMLKGFGSFGFCKAHAAAFATTTYESAWMKAHHPAAFLAGLLEHDPGMYPRRLIVAEARRLGIPMLGVDANRSGEHYRVEDVAGGPGVRLPFTQVGGISQAQVARLVAGQPYASVADVLLRARPSRPVLRRLAAVGAFDALAPGRTRGDLIAHTRRLGAATVRPAPPGQDALPLDVVEDVPSGVPEPSAQELVAAELDVLHVDVTAHLLDPWRPMLDELGVTPADQLLRVRNDSLVLVAGVRVASGTPPTKTGARVVFISLDDGTGVADTAFFDDAQRQAGANLFQADLMLVQGRTRRTGPRGISITATNAWDLRALPAGLG